MVYKGLFSVTGIIKQEVIMAEVTRSSCRLKTTRLIFQQVAASPVDLPHKRLVTYPES